MSTTLEERIRDYATMLDASAAGAIVDPSARRVGQVVELAPADSPRRRVPPHRDRRLLAVAAAVLFAILAGTLIVLAAQGKGDDRVTTVTSTPSSTTTTVAPTTTTVPTTTTPRSSEAEALAPFFSGAVELDGRLRTAAADVNADLGPTMADFRDSTVLAVRAADPQPLVKTIPAGLSTAMERAVLVAFSELVSRYDSMRDCVDPGKWLRSQLGPFCFVHGGPAAARFPADLAAARDLAASLDRTPAAAPGSRAAAELALQIDVIYENNGGCGATGGFILSDLAVVTWQSGGTPPMNSDGTIGGMQFQASYAATTGWTTRLLVC